MRLREVRKRARRLLTVSIMAAIACTGLSAPATAEFVPQMETNLSFDPSVVLAPSVDRPNPVVTWEGTLWFRGFESVPKAFNTTATLSLPSGVTVESVSPPQCHVKDLVVTCPFGTLLSDVQQTITVQARVDQAQVGDRLGATMSAQAQNVSVSPGREPIGPLVVDNKADLEVDFFSWRESVLPGGEASYGIEAINNGPLTTAPATLIINPGPQLTAAQVDVDDPNTCTSSTEGFRCPFTRFIRLELSGIASPDGEGTILATSAHVEFAGDDPPVDPQPDNNIETKTTHIEQRADLAVTMSLTPDTVPAADLVNKPTLTYRAVVTNRGPGLARQTELQVQLNDKGLEFVSAPADCVHDFAVRCAVGDLPVGASREYVIQAKATQGIRGTRVDVEAEATAANNDFDRPNDDRSLTTLNVPGNLADLGVDIRGVPDPLAAGQPVTVVTDVTNHGPLPTANAAVQISLDTPLSNAQVQTESGTCQISSGRFVQCTVNGLTADPVTIQITGTAALNPGDRLTGRASINTVGGTGIPQDDNRLNNLDLLNVPVVAPVTTAERA